MSLAASKSISRVTGKEGNIYGWSGQQDLTSSALTLLEYNNPAYFYLTRITLALDFSLMAAGQVLSFTINVDGQGLFVEKYDLTAANIGIQPKPYEFIMPPNSLVKVQATQSANAGSIGVVLVGFRL